MRLPVDRLSDSPTEYQFEADSAWWQDACSVVPELSRGDDGAFRFELRAHRMGVELHLEGEVIGRLELTCGRCLNRYRESLRERFRLVLEPAGDRVPADPEGAAALEADGLWVGDELESGWFRGPTLRLSAYLREVVVLMLPLQSVCREGCSGLCPSCGIDRNQESCDCSEPVSHSPFAMLGALETERKGRG